MRIKPLVMMKCWLPLILIVTSVEGATRQMSLVTLNQPNLSTVNRAGILKFANGETRRFVAISGVRDCSYDKHEIQVGKLILGLFPSPSTPTYIFVSLEKVTTIKFAKIYKQYDGGGSTGTAVEITMADGKKETFEARLLNIQVDLSDSVAAAQYTHYQLWGSEISFDKTAPTNK